MAAVVPSQVMARTAGSGARAAWAQDALPLGGTVSLLLLGAVVLVHGSLVWVLWHLASRHPQVSEPQPVAIEWVVPQVTPAPRELPSPAATQRPPVAAAPAAAPTRPPQPAPARVPQPPAPVLATPAATSRNDPAPMVVPEPQAPVARAPINPSPDPTPAPPALTQPVAPAAAPTPKAVAASAIVCPEHPSPVYPDASRRLGESGKVVVKVGLDAQGHPSEVTVHKSSGRARLDEAALTAARLLRCKPYTENGVAWPVTVLQPYNFDLEE